MRTHFTHGSHLPSGDLEHRAMVSGIAILLLVLLLYLLGVILTAPHSTVISLGA
jgi:hypothetical protein